LVLAVALGGCFGHRAPYVVAEGDMARFAPTEIPLSFGGHDGRYAVIRPVIQGQGFDLMLDTGAGWATVTLTPAALERLDVTYTGGAVTHRDAEGKLYRAREFTIPSLTVGGLELTNVPAYENLTSPPGFDGYVGLGLLRNFNVLIDYGARKMTLYRKGEVPAFIADEGWYRYEYSGAQQFDVRFEGVTGEYRIGLDTGSNATAIPAGSDLAEAIIECYAIPVENVVVNERTGQEVLFFKIDLSLGEHALGEHDCVITDMAGYMGNGVMGYDFFINNKVFADFDANTVWLKEAE
jgi:hypothetical protein